ncbi:POXA3b laccase small subunit [Mycena vulgaris]|nr:POXA3b laccase small subunit [Mycena vulgaris]
MLPMRFFVLALVSVVSCSNLAARANTNAAINTIVDDLDISLHHTGPTILTLQAQHKFSDITIGQQMTDLGTAFSKARTSLASTAVSSGSVDVRPTNDDISITYSDIMQTFTSSLSGIKGTGLVPHFPDMVKVLDPIVANASLQLNLTSPASLILVKKMMTDAKQFLLAEGFNLTLAAIGWPAA